MSKKTRKKNSSPVEPAAEEMMMTTSDVEHIAALKNSYDNVVYKSKSFPATSIASLEAKGRIWGLNPVPVEKARVLELGCSMGGNIIGQAAHYPKGTYVGVDLSSTQIDVGNQIISFTGLKNIRLEEKNIMDIDASFGTFDYIIVHGIWAWVPDVVKEKILDICRVNLSKRGIAYISYNTYPGWKRLSQIRDIMLYSVRNNKNYSLEQKTDKGIQVCQDLADIMDQTASVKNSTSWKINNLRNITSHQKYYISHEYFETFNDPVYVHEFISRAEDHGLCHIADTEFSQSCITWLRPEIRKTLEELSEGDNTAKEQFIDHYYDTQFRRSLLCHKELEGQINRNEEIQLDVINRLYFKYPTSASELKDTENCIEQGLVNLCRKGVPFSISEVITEIDKLQNGKVYDKLDAYRILVRFLFAGLIQPFSVAQPNDSFVENVSTVPKELCNYVETITQKGGHQFIDIANLYNEGITGLDLGHIFVMRQLETPKSMEELKAAVNDGLVVTKTHDDGTKEQLLGETRLEAILNDLSQIGFLRNKAK